jgi:hypothetical protein
VETAISRSRAAALNKKQSKVRRDSQGSLPKSAASAYLYEKPTEL